MKARFVFVFNQGNNSTSAEITELETLPRIGEEVLLTRMALPKEIQQFDDATEDEEWKVALRPEVWLVVNIVHDLTYEKLPILYLADKTTRADLLPLQPEPNVRSVTFARSGPLGPTVVDDAVEALLKHKKELEELDQVLEPGRRDIREKETRQKDGDVGGGEDGGGDDGGDDGREPGGTLGRRP